jgi:hypothetical protein
VNAFDLWLVIVGLAIGAGLAALVMVDLRRRDDDISAREARSEAAWIADTLRSDEIAADPEAVEEVLRLHRAYLAGMPDERVWLPGTPIDTRATAGHAEAGAADEHGPAAGMARDAMGDAPPAIGMATSPDRAEAVDDALVHRAPADDEPVYRAPAEDR